MNWHFSPQKSDHRIECLYSVIIYCCILLYTIIIYTPHISCGNSEIYIILIHILPYTKSRPCVRYCIRYCGDKGSPLFGVQNQWGWVSSPLGTSLKLLGKFHLLLRQSHPTHCRNSTLSQFIFFLCESLIPSEIPSQVCSRINGGQASEIRQLLPLNL